MDGSIGSLHEADQLDPCITAKRKASAVKNLVKHLRVCRNVYHRHKAGTGKDVWDTEAMTGYERGRMTKESPRLYAQIDKLYWSGDEKCAMWFMAYCELTGLRPSWFNKPGTANWSWMHERTREAFEKDVLDHSQAQQLLEQITEMLDIPLSEVPARYMMFKLSVR